MSAFPQAFTPGRRRSPGIALALSLLLLGADAGTRSEAQQSAPAGVGAPPAFATHGSAPVYRTPAELESLVASIALYPDELLAIVLPAATWPAQVAQAARYLTVRASNPAIAPAPGWDASVVALLDYPEVVARLDHELDWTARLGAAVVHQQADVLAAVAAFRERAHASGNLVSDSRQAVHREDGMLTIRPAQADVVYVPYYQPTQVVVRHEAPAYYYHPRPRMRPSYFPPYGFGDHGAWALAPSLSFGFSRHDHRALRRDFHDRRVHDGGRRHEDGRRLRGRDDHGYDRHDHASRGHFNDGRTGRERGARGPTSVRQAATGAPRAARRAAPTRSTPAPAPHGPAPTWQGAAAGAPPPPP
ncbi:MAG: DUF3300 domain-containing protein, partial [Gammaproteobacteria bacterium]